MKEFFTQTLTTEASVVEESMNTDMDKQKEVYIFNLAAADTREGMVLKRLFDARALFIKVLHAL